MNNDHDRIGALDGLRALAILLVLTGHSVLYVYFYEGPRMVLFGSRHLTWFLMNGWTGVNLFFVLSGFLITRQLLAVFAAPRASQRPLLLAYARKRFFRIVPAYYLVLLALLSPQFPLMTGEPAAASWFWHLLCYGLFLQDYFQQTVFAQFWSLAVEMQFYLFAPFMVLCLTRLRPGRLYLVLLLAMAALLLVRMLAASMAPPVQNETLFLVLFRAPFHMSLDSLIAGVAACFLWHDARLRPLLEKPLCADLLFAAGAGLFIAMTAFTAPHFLSFPRPVTFFAETGYFTALAAGFAAMLLGLLGGGAAGRLFSARPLRIIALLSYSMYLLHIQLAPVAMRMSDKILPGAALTTYWCLDFIIFLAMVTPLAALMYRFVERPFNAWARQPG